MKKAMRVSLPIVFTISILFVPSCFVNSQVMLQWRFLGCVLTAIIIFASQPPVTKEDLYNSTDKYSMLGICLMSVIVINSSTIKYALDENLHNSLKAVDLLGICMILFGLALRIYSIVSLNIYFSNPVKIQSGHQLVNTGIYAIIRHPSYTGAIMTILGTILLLNAFQCLPFSILLIGLAYYHRISQEERLLTEYFGSKYKDYIKQTGCLLPKIKISHNK